MNFVPRCLPPLTLVSRFAFRVSRFAFSVASPFLIEKVTQQLHWQRENDRGVLFHSDLGERLQVTQLDRGWFAGEDLCGVGQTGGGYLTALMTRTQAPIVSRWASILLRRALLSDVDTPAHVKPADWVAERAWLLLRMGEADAARLLVQSVDTPDFTPRLFAIAMQTYLATADPAGLCPLTGQALRVSDEPSWKLSRAICAALSNDQGMASAVLNEAEHRGTARGIDFRLAEKVVGAGLNSRRSVNVEWEGVDRRL